MKKLLLIIIVFAFVFNGNAQGVDFGVKAGVNFASLTGDDVDDLDGKTSFHFGVVARIPVSDNFSVQPELIFSSQGAKEGDGEVNLDYINLPIMANISLGTGFSLQAGPQIGFNIKDEAEFDGETESLDAESIDFGAAFGAQYELPSGLFFQARYALGFSEIVKDVDAKNSVLSISIGWTFGKSGGSDD